MLNVDIEEESHDFIDSLKNGIMLAKLSNTWLDEKNQSSNIRTATLGNNLELLTANDNINLFFDSCKKIEFPRSYWFRFPDLWERRNPLLVIHCIHSLAHFLERKGKTKIKIKDLSGHGLQFDAKKIEKASKELEQLQKDGINTDYNFGRDLMLPQDLDRYKQKGIVREIDHLDGLEEELLRFADPDRSYWEGKGARLAYAGKLSQFTIIARDALGDLDSGGEKFHCQMKYMKTGELVPVKVTDLNNGKYLCQYTAYKTGMLQLSVDLASGEDGQSKLLKGSPCQVECKDSQITKSLEIISGLEKEYIEGKYYKLTLQAKDEFDNLRQSGGDNFKCQIRYSKDKDSGPITVDTSSISDLGNGKYEVNLRLPIRGVYQLRLMEPTVDGTGEKQFEGFKPLVLRAKPGSAPELQVSFDPLRPGQTVVQFKATEQLLEKKHDRYISMFLKLPVNGDLSDSQRGNIEKLTQDRWKDWIREYYTNLANKLDINENSWGTYEDREKDLLEQFQKLQFPSDNSSNGQGSVQFVSINDEKMTGQTTRRKDWRLLKRIPLTQSPSPQK